MPRHITIGADPEIAVCKNIAKRGRTFIPVCGLIGGTKGNPVHHSEAGGWIEDGVMAELNPKESDDVLKLAANVITLRNAVQDKLKEQDKNFYLYTAAYGMYDKTELAKHSQAVEFGCSPDYDAYNPQEPRQPPMDKALAEVDEKIRFAGGHVHIGVEDWPEKLPKFVAVRFLDLLLHRPAYSIIEGTTYRTKYYGLPGLYRPTKYGIEYRTPSNAWLNELDNGRVDYLARAHRVASLFADFENYRSHMVDLYNEVDWSRFSSSMSSPMVGLDEHDPRDYFRGNIVDGHILSIGDQRFSVIDYRLGNRIDMKSDSNKLRLNNGIAIDFRRIEREAIEGDWEVRSYWPVEDGDEDEITTSYFINPANLVIVLSQAEVLQWGSIVDVDYEDGKIWIEFPRGYEGFLAPRPGRGEEHVQVNINW